MLKEHEREQIKGMNMTLGWKLVKDDIQRKIESLTTRLVLNDHKSLSDVTYLQGQIKSLRELINQYDITE